MVENDSLLTPEEAAEFLRVDIRTIYRWLKNGTLAGAKIADTWRIRQSTIVALFENMKGTNSANDPAP